MTTMETAMNGKTVKKTSASGRTNGITKIQIDRIDPEIVRASAARYGLAVGEEDSPELIATSLWTYFQNSAKETKKPLFECDAQLGGCGGKVIDEDGPCAFCGFEEGAEEDEEEMEAGSEEPEEDAPVSRPQPIIEAQPEPIAEGAEFAEGSNPEPVATSPVEPRKKPGPKPRSQKPGKVDKEGEMPAPGSSTGLAKVVSSAQMVVDDTTPASQVQTAHDLDAAVETYKKASAATFLAWWHEGRSLLEIFSKKLWTLRVDKATKAPAYKTFQQFVEAEIKLTPNLVFKKMDAAKAFTEAQAAKLGMSNCVLLMQAPEEVRQTIEAKISKGEIRTAADTRSEVKKANKAKGTVKTKGSKSGERATGGGRKKEYVKLAIASQLGKDRLAMYEAADEGEKPVRVEVPAVVEKWLLKANPFAEHESLDGEISEVFSLSVKDGKLALVITRSRATEEE